MDEVMYLKKPKMVQNNGPPPPPQKKEREKKQIKTKVKFYFGDKPLRAMPLNFKSSFTG